jgi:hypothetical protein
MMQIELIGCTSAGKSSLAQKLLKGNQQNGVDLVLSYDFVLRWAHLDWIKNHRIRMLSLNLIALFACLLTIRKNFKFYRFVVGVIVRLPADVSYFEKLKIARIVARNMGIYEIVCRKQSDQQVVLADEGTLHIAHYLFVHVSVEPKVSDIDTFVRLVSLPDVAVYVRQPESVLIARTRIRRHKRIPDDASTLVNRFIQNGLAVFEKLVECSILESRLLVVNNGEGINTALDHPDNPLLGFARKIISFGVYPDELGNTH